MRVGVNAQLLYLSDSYRAAGISRYIHQLLAHMRPLAGPDQELVVFTGRWRLPAELAPTDYFRVRQTRLPTWKPPVRIAWEQMLQPASAAVERLDLLHSMGYVQPVLSTTRSVVTMLDLSFLRMPEAFNRWNRVYLATMTRLSAKRCDRIIAISESTRQDIVRFLAVPREKVEVIYCGVDPSYRPIDDASLLNGFRRSRGLPDRFHPVPGNPGAAEERGAIGGGVCPDPATSAHSHKLVLGGARGWLYDRIFARVRELGLMEDVIFADYIPDDELPLWYNCADIFIYPSLYEGFGLPPLEAMACGTPVITSSVSSLPEVAGTAALMVNPLDIDGLANAIVRVLEEDPLRQKLQMAGPRQAARFQWAEAAARTMKVYQNVGSRAAN